MVDTQEINKNPKQILVTGATGRIGCVLVQALVERGDQVRALVLEGDQHLSRLSGLDVDVMFGDLSSGEGVSRACMDVDAVIHLGALIAWSQEDWPRLFDINLRGTFNLMQAVAKEAPDVKRIVLASTDASYPASSSLYTPVDEHHPQLPNTFYAMTKQLGEKMGQFYARKFGLPVTRARFSLTLAPEEVIDPSNHRFYLNSRLRNLRQSDSTNPQIRESISILEQIKSDEDTERILISYGQEGKSWRYTLCHVKDLVSGIMLLMDREEAIGEVFNLGPATSFAVDIALKYMSQVTGTPYVEARLPGPAMVYEVNIGKAKSVLGYKPEYDIFDIIDQAAATVDN